VNDLPLPMIRSFIARVFSRYVSTPTNRCKPSSVIAAWERPTRHSFFATIRADSLDVGAEERTWLPTRLLLTSHMVTLHQERTLSRAARLLALLQALRCRRRPVTAAALARELHVSERTIYRDLSELAAQGAPVQGEAGVGYMLRPGLFLPPLMLTEDETEAVLLGLRYVDEQRDDDRDVHVVGKRRGKITFDNMTEFFVRRCDQNAELAPPCCWARNRSFPCPSPPAVSCNQWA
jgi:biotin operon repressor